MDSGLRGRAKAAGDRFAPDSVDETFVAHPAPLLCLAGWSMGFSGDLTQPNGSDKTSPAVGLLQKPCTVNGKLQTRSLRGKTVEKL